MGLKEFIKCLKDPTHLGEIGHLSCFVYWAKNKEKHLYRDILGDCGLIHLLFHCLGSKQQAEINGEYIYKLFKEDIRLV
ncbi:hypothetical protein [Aquimarina macrocephali]|uniref:hypothetical protein n=1 Tax=Aquimarina macrocephali TaxID=666563 RepID=UPI003F6777A9